MNNVYTSRTRTGTEMRTGRTEPEPNDITRGSVPVRVTRTALPWIHPLPDGDNDKKIR